MRRNVPNHMTESERILHKRVNKRLRIAWEKGVLKEMIELIEQERREKQTK